MIKFVFLDLDDTILDFHRSEANAIRRTLRALSGQEPSYATVKRYSEINDAQWKRLELGELTAEEVKLVRFALLFRELGWELSPTAARDTYEEFLSEGHDVFDGAMAFLERLSERYPLYLASNGAPMMQRRRIADAGIDCFFREIFISGELGAVKPQRAFFDACFARIPQFAPQEGIILGDSLTSDIQGGRDAGMHTCRFNPQRIPGCADIVPEFEIAHYDAFFEILDSLQH